MKTDYYKEVSDSIDKEFDDFKEEILTKSPIDIFYSNYKIHVTTELYEVLSENSYFDDIYYKILYKEKGHILSSLYEDFLSNEYSSVNTGSDTSDFIKDYCRTYYKKYFN